MGICIGLKIGQTYNRLTVLSREENSVNNSSRWLCRCSCGKEKIILGSRIANGKSKSCGCLNQEVSRLNFKHRMVKTPTYYAWVNLKVRCEGNGKKNKSYKENGITVCDRWQVFSNFFEDMGVKPEGMTLDRINNNDGYYKENCRWVTQSENSRNKKKSIIWTIDGIDYNSCFDAAKAHNKTYTVILRWCKGRMCRGKFLEPYPNCSWRYKYNEDK